MNHLLLRSRLLPISHSVGRPFSRLPLPSSIPPSSLRPLVAFSPLSASPPHLILPAHTRTIPLASTGQSVKLISDGGPLEQGGRECWVLGNGSLVGWGWHSDEFRPWAEQLLKLKGSKLKGEEEQLDFSVDSEVDAPRFERDVLVLPTSASQSTPASSPSTPSSSSIPESELTQLLIRYAVSEALSHSSQLNVVEGQLDSLLSKDIDVPSFLAKHGRGPYSRKQVIQRLGEFMEVRQAVSLKGLGDLPDFYWEEPLLEKYFKDTWQLLEIQKRVRTVNERISHAQEVNGILKDLLTEQSTHNMEIIIIALIAVEVVLAFWSHWEELREAMGYPSRAPPRVTHEETVV